MDKLTSKTALAQAMATFYLWGSGGCHGLFFYCAPLAAGVPPHPHARQRPGAADALQRLTRKTVRSRGSSHTRTNRSRSLWPCSKPRQASAHKPPFWHVFAHSRTKMRGTSLNKRHPDRQKPAKNRFCYPPAWDRHQF